jgi:hypothetical protein
MSLLYQCYELTGDGLVCPLTQQRLHAVGGCQGGVLFDYADAEVHTRIIVGFTPSGAADEWLSARVDWNAPEHRAVRESYGLWRRLTWFLLDALLVWQDEGGRSASGVSISGAWVAGRWFSDARCSTGLNLSGTHRDDLIEEIAPFDLFPLDTPAPYWRYMPGPSGTREAWLATCGELDRVFVADASDTLESQLAEVPRFISSDGNTLFFHKVSPNVGPEYAPAIQYGFADGDFAFYFTGRHGDLRGKPIMLRPGLVPSHAALRQQGESWFRGDRPPEPVLRLHPRRREALYFAIAEVVAITSASRSADWPVMTDPEFGQSVPFGSELWHISDAPMSVGLPFCKIEFWPGNEWRALHGADSGAICSSRNLKAQGTYALFRTTGLQHLGRGGTQGDVPSEGKAPGASTAAPWAGALMLLVLAALSVAGAIWLWNRAPQWRYGPEWMLVETGRNRTAAKVLLASSVVLLGVAVTGVQQLLRSRSQRPPP